MWGLPMRNLALTSHTTVGPSGPGNNWTGSLILLDSDDLTFSNVLIRRSPASELREAACGSAGYLGYLGLQNLGKYRTHKAIASHSKCGILGCKYKGILQLKAIDNPATRYSGLLSRIFVTVKSPFDFCLSNLTLSLSRQQRLYQHGQHYLSSPHN